jgi:hypothetical protein
MALKRSTRIWLEGAIRAAATGLSSVLVVNAVDPHDFGILDNFGKACLLGGIMSFVQFVQFLTQKPLPNPDDDSTDMVTREMPVHTLMGTGKGTGDGS